MNDDDVDFKPSQSARPRPTDNQSLTYTPPKPPKAGESSGTPVRGSSSKSLGTEKLEIIVSKNIQLYKLENGKYVVQGTAGVAIIGHYDLHMYQIILYKNNKEYLSKTYVQPNFTFTVLENNYASFYDNARQNWSILFPSSSDVQQFAKQVAIAKYNSQSKQEQIIVQDLIPPGSAKANKRDIVKLDCSCSLLNKDDIIPFKEKSNWSVEVSDTYSFPWQEGLKDCSHKCKRVVITPYKLSAPWTDEINENTSVVVEIEVESIRPPERLPQNKGMYSKSKTQDESTTDSSADEDNCKAKPVSIKDSIFLSRSHKADLISRIAKMGQALPLKVAFACGPTDTPEENARQSNNLRGVDNQPSNIRPCSPQHTDTRQPHLLSASSSRRCENDVAWQQQQMRGGMNFAYQELHPLMSGPPGPSGQSYGRGPETTGTDAELRFTINKVSEKVDHVLNKLQNFDATGWDKVKAHQSATVLDPISVINSIQDVMAENECLKQEIQQQKSKINEQGSKLHSLMELTQRCVERCAYSDRKPAMTPATPDKIIGLEERLNMSDQLMMEANTRMNQLTSEIEKYRKEISENQQQIRQCNTEIQSLVDKLKEKEKVIRNMETENEALINANHLQKKEIQQFKQQDTGEKSTEPEPTLSQDSIEEIKKVMNAVNRKLQSYFDSDESYTGKDIKATIAATLKDVTMEYLKYRNKQKTTSRLDVLGTNDAKRGISHGQLAAEHGPHNADDWRKEKSKVASEVIKASSQRLAFADQQPPQTTTTFAEKPVEEPARLQSRLGQESSVHVTAPASRRTTPDVSGHTSDLKTMESLVHQLAGASRVLGNESVSSRPIIESSMTPNASALTHDMKSGESVRGVSSRGSDIPVRTSGEMKSKTSQIMKGSSLSERFRRSAEEDEDEVSSKHSGVTTTASSATSTRTLPSVMQSTTHRSTITPSHVPSGRDESVKGDVSTITGELESLLEDHEAENVEIEKSAVTLTNTLSDVTRGPTAPPSSYRSTIAGKVETASTLGMGSSSIRQESAMQSRVTAAGQPSETDEKLRSGTLSEAESFVFVGGERSPQIGSSRALRESYTQATPGRSVITVRGESSDGGGRQKASSSDRTIADEESFVITGEESTGDAIHQESVTQPTPDRSTLTTKRLPSEMDVSFAKHEIYHRSGTETENEEQSLVTAEKSSKIIPSRGQSTVPSVTAEAETRDLRKSISETDLGGKFEPDTPVEEGSIANLETEKSSLLLNKTMSNVVKDASNRGNVDLGSEESSVLKEDIEDGSQVRGEEKSSDTDREEIDDNKEKENGKDETDKGSVDEKLESASTSDENIRSSGSNAIHDALLYSDYYQGWESSKPPPLPVEDDDESSGTDEEWL